MVGTARPLRSGGNRRLCDRNPTTSRITVAWAGGSNMFGHGRYHPLNGGVPRLRFLPYRALTSGFASSGAARRPPYDNTHWRTEMKKTILALVVIAVLVPAAAFAAAPQDASTFCKTNAATLI